ncbi:DMT family transporter [Candidatus Woesearchaeota archaeon]|nr:MAG: DMT family transporter [Candidatus Woesearchaeota archaeon]
MRGTITAFLAIAFFSLYFVFAKLLLANISPFIIMVLNQATAGIIIILILDLFKKISEIKNTSKYDFKSIFVISIFTAVVGPTLFLFGLDYSSATNAILIGKSEALITSLLAIIMLKERITKQQIIGGVIMFLGVIIIATKNFSSGLRLELGDTLIFFAAVSYATGTVLFKKYVDHLPPEVIVTLRNLYGAIILFVISLMFVDYSTVLQIISLKFVLVFLGMVIFVTIFGQYLWYRALEATSATKVSLAGLSSPLIAIVYAIIFLDERLVSSQMLGGALIMAGLIILELHFRKTYTHKRHKFHLKLKHWHHI